MEGVGRRCPLYQERSYAEAKPVKAFPAPTACAPVSNSGIMHWGWSRLPKAALRLHGRYIGYMRQLKSRALAEVRACEEGGQGRPSASGTLPAAPRAHK